MPADNNVEIRHIYERWHEAVKARDLDGLMALYDSGAMFETPLILAIWPDRGSGILEGSVEIRAFFAAGFGNPRSGLGRWYRTGVFFSNGRQLIWEYPRETPEGDQGDLVEVMDVAQGVIVHHRVYWGWVGFKVLQASLDRLL